MNTFALLRFINTSLNLSFQEYVSDDYKTSYKQHRDQWLEVIFRCEGQLNKQNIGRVLNRQGYLLTFPNTLQHLVNPFRLADLSRPGHRKIFALFLVDPNIHILSIAHIPCQRHDEEREEDEEKEEVEEEEEDEEEDDDDNEDGYDDEGEEEEGDEENENEEEEEEEDSEEDEEDDQE